MEDCFNLNEINENLLDLVGSLAKIPIICRNYVISPTNLNGDEIVKILENSEKKMVKVKKNIVKMVNNVEVTENEMKGD